MSKNRTKRRRSKMHWVWSFLFLALMLVVFVTWRGQTATYQRLQAKQDVLQPQLDELREENRNLTAALDNSDSDAFVEEVAREQLGMVRDNEIIFVDDEEAAVLEDKDVLPDSIERQVGGE